MWRHTALVTALTCVCVTSLSGQGTPDFSGKWMLDQEMSVIGGRGTAAAELTITQDATTLTVTRATNSGAQSVTYKLDGSEAKNPAGSGEAVYRSKWEGGKLVTTITTPTRTGQSTRTETFSIVDGTFRIDTSRPDPQGGAPYVGRIIYRRG